MRWIVSVTILSYGSLSSRSRRSTSKIKWEFGHLLVQRDRCVLCFPKVVLGAFIDAVSTARERSQKILSGAVTVT